MFKICIHISGQKSRSVKVNSTIYHPPNAPRFDNVAVVSTFIRYCSVPFSKIYSAAGVVDLSNLFCNWMVLDDYSLRTFNRLLWGKKHN